MYEDEWLTNPLSVKMIANVDKSTVIGNHLIESPVLGPISPKELSGGVKTLILMAVLFIKYLRTLGFSATNHGGNKYEDQIETKQ